MRWSHTAAFDLDEICAFIGRESAYYPSVFARRIIASTRLAGQFPELGRIVPEYGDPSLREIIYQSYRVVYRVLPEAVEIVQICHGAKQLRNIGGGSVSKEDTR